MTATGEPILLVVRNDEDQYSIWPGHRAVPAGWQPMGVAGSEDECLAHIERVWTDLRPRGARRPETGPVRAVHHTERLQLREVLPAETACRRVDGHRHRSWAPGYSPGKPPRLAGAGGSAYEIVLTATGQVIGDLGHEPDGADGTGHRIWYALEPLSRGHGHAAEAVDALAAHLLSRPGVDTVTIVNDEADPVGSGAVLRAGFAPAGRTDPPVGEGQG